MERFPHIARSALSHLALLTWGALGSAEHAEAAEGPLRWGRPMSQVGRSFDPFIAVRCVASAARRAAIICAITIASLTASFVEQAVALTPQTISFTSPAPVGATVGGPTYTVTATATSGLAVAFTIDAASSAVCSISGATVSFIGGGTCTINANQAGNGTNAAAPQVQQSFGVATVSPTTTSLTSTPNPSAFGQSVAFTATVTGASPTGTVTFKDGAATLGTGTLNGAGQATLSTSSLTVGSHSITAVYGGNATNLTSTSSALTQVVAVPPDSVRLQALQVAATKLVAQSSGQTVSGAIDNAIAEGFSDNGELITPSDNGLHFNFAAEPNKRSAVEERVGDTFAALGYSGRGHDSAYKAPRPAPREWLAWADVRGTGWNTGVQTGDIRGGQTNALAGLTRKLMPDFLVGVFAGYESFNYTSQMLNGRLKGDGWTAGGYLGWRLLPGLRFDAGLAHSGINYDGQAGTALGTFQGQRWFASAGLLGAYKTKGFAVEPSAKVYALWERESAYVDSLGIQHTNHDFSNGRASTGAKVAYPWLWPAGATVAPYAGIYADYYFNRTNVVPLGAPNLLPTEFVHGLSARVVSGFDVAMKAGPRFSVGGELGGLGNDFKVWSVRGRATVPF